MDKCYPVKEFLTQNQEHFRVETATSFAKPVSANEIEKMVFPPMVWIMESVLTTGLYMLAGRPKSGKSWMSLNMAIAVALGGIAMSFFKCAIADVLYIAYEDNKRRIQSRLQNISNQECSSSSPANLHFYSIGDFPQLNDGGLDQLSSLLKQNKNIKLIIVDTYGRGIKQMKSKNNNTFLDDYEYSANLQEFAIKNDICLLLVHHTRKLKGDNPFDDISGTTGIQAAADGLLVLNKQNGRTFLHCTGKDIEENSYEVEFKAGLWKIISKSECLIYSVEQQELIDCFNSDKTKVLRTSELATIVGKSESNISHLCRKLLLNGSLVKVKNGCYQLA
jgi:RecA-family ATPase